MSIIKSTKKVKSEKDKKPKKLLSKSTIKKSSPEKKAQTSTITTSLNREYVTTQTGLQHIAPGIVIKKEIKKEWTKKNEKLPDYDCHVRIMIEGTEQKAFFNKKTNSFLTPEKKPIIRVIESWIEDDIKTI